MRGAMARLGPVLSHMMKHDGLATRTELVEHGVPESTINRWVRDGVLTRVHPGCYRLPGLPWDFTAKTRASTMIAGPACGAGFRTAAALWNLDGARATIIELIGPRRAIKPHDFYYRHRSVDLLPGEVTSIDGVAVTSVARTLLDVGRFVDDERLGRMVDDAHRRDLVTHDELAARFLEISRRGRPGAARLRRVLAVRTDQIGPQATTFERMFERLVETASLPKPVRQFHIHVDGRNYYVDHAWPEFGVGSECDSMLVHSTPEQLAADLERQNRILGTGLVLKRFTYRDVRDRPNYVIAQLRHALGRMTGEPVRARRHE